MIECIVPKAVTFLPFLMSCTRTHLRMAELGCLASTPTFSRTMPLACDEPCRKMSRQRMHFLQISPRHTSHGPMSCVRMRMISSSFPSDACVVVTVGDSLRMAMT